MNNPTVKTSLAPPAGGRGAPVADLEWDIDEDTVPSTPYVHRGCAAIKRARLSVGLLLQMLSGWLVAAWRGALPRE